MRPGFLQIQHPCLQLPTSGLQIDGHVGETALVYLTSSSSLHNLFVHW